MLIHSVAALALAAAQPAAPPLPSPPQLPPPGAARPFDGMAFLVGHCWSGTFASGDVDTHCFEPVYSGRLIRDRHQVTGGYAGETIYNWNANRAQVEYTYWNVSGGVSRGTMRERDGLLDFGDEVYRNAAGRETRIATTWRRIDELSYEVRVTSSADPTGSRVIRYNRVDRAPVGVSSSQAPDRRHSLIHETIVEAPVFHVWEAIATADGWRTWAVPVARAPEPDVIETSYSPAAQPGDPSTIQQRIVAAVPGRLLVFRTIRAPQGFPDFDTFAQVTSIFELEPLGENRTRVRLTGAGYADTEAGRRLLGFFREGNRVSLERLQQRFRTGPLDWPAELRR